MIDTREDLDPFALIKTVHFILISENGHFFSIFLIDGWKGMNFMSQRAAFKIFFKLLFIS